MIEKERLISLVCSVQQGADGAETELYQTFFDDIYYQILKTVNNDSELAADLTQDTFIEILQTIGKLEEPVAFVTWSKQIAYHKCTAYFRKRKELLADENEDGHSLFDDLQEERTEFIPDEALNQADLRSTIQAMVDHLPEEQKTALLLRYFNEIPVKEIAKIQGVSEGTVKSRLNYGRKAIQKSVEDYERKNNVKLHCAGVVPLLLWFFRANHISAGAAVTNTATAAYVAAETTSSATTVTGNVVKHGAKATAKAIRTKVIAGVAAAAVATGGIAVALNTRSEPEAWCGYGKVFYSHKNRRFEMTIEQRDDTYISGHLEMTSLYKLVHETDFTGTGTEKDGIIYYDLTLDTPLTANYVSSDFGEITAEYHEDTQEISMDGFLDVVMHDAQADATLPVLRKNQSWSGLGEDDFYIHIHNDDHQFDLMVEEMTAAAITGQLTVSHQGNIDHESAFTGRGYTENGYIYYEILLETPRSEKVVIDVSVESFWMCYDTEQNTFEILSPSLYRVIMSQ